MTFRRRVRSVAARVFLAPCVFLAACGDGQPGIPWERVEDDTLDGIDFREAWGVGEEVWALGQPYDLPISVVVHHDGARWGVLTGGDDLPEHSYSLWATSSDDVWLAGDDSSLWHWDGAIWSQVDLSDALGGMTAKARSVWGTGRDDMWISLDLDDTEHIVVRDSGAGWETMFSVPIEGQYEVQYDEPYGQGCSVSRDDVWLRAPIWADSDMYFQLVHWRGEMWDEVQGRGGPFFCSPTAIWSYENFAGGPEVHRNTGDEWSNVVSEGSRARFYGLWAGEDGDGWIVGSEQEDESQELAEIWRISGDEVTATLEPGSDTASFPIWEGAIWQTASGRVFAFGSNGLVLEYTGPE